MAATRIYRPKSRAPTDPRDIFTLPTALCNHSETMPSKKILSIGAWVLCSYLSAAQPDAATRGLARDIFQQLIEINTTDSVGSTTTAAQAMAKRLLAAGFAAEGIQVLGPNDRKRNLVARYRGTGSAGLRPILIIGHLDVVEARREDWTTDPFQFIEKDGYYYGRGTQDMKVNDAILDRK